MTKKQKKELVEALKNRLYVADVKYGETPDNASWCYGYLIGVIREAIWQLEQ